MNNMTDEEAKEFKASVVAEVNSQNQAAYNKTVKAYDKHSADIERILSKIVPDIIERMATKPNYWFPILLNVINGVILGVAMYIAIIFGIEG